MKNTLTFLAIFLVQVAVYSQLSIEGTYQLKVDATNATLQRTLTLNSDGTFVFHSYEKHEQGLPKEKNFYGKGTWTVEKNVIIFKTKSSDLDEKYQLDLTGTQARFDRKSPRDKSDRDIKTSLRFFASEIFWIKGMTLIKTD
ncbi:copper resistance protein NlpE [Subsaxibacter sp. CAU 1640]|uniref:copper resistance protein NlpE N-terminal domain-containing protein n=1 Tax=Subsaxibacter sp. CAU 1640 TaxID=2933271 RepID=UPI002002F614|nr:copper resistance protein NlpE N-terminal domain-containing protein [Subsaxibacter sp. CAU 1640]MCK7589615.1 copper resistance protein NlpE [Subsaxibacter sp. CAU 1640]